MRALNFLEWYLKQADDDINRDITVANFLNKPFKPGMITELFEGWINSSNSFNDKIYTLKHEEFVDGNTEWRLIFSRIHGVNYWNGLSLHFPKTLDHFITDCQRAGIELTWKPEIEGKYFK